MPAMFKKALLLVLVLPVLSAATAASHETSEVMQLSSWQSEAVDGTIVGGTQSVTIVNTAATSANGVTFQLEAPPCECTLDSASTASGAVRNGIWVIGELDAGASATLELVYVAKN
jgi:hypothetical protein